MCTNGIWKNINIFRFTEQEQLLKKEGLHIDFGLFLLTHLKRSAAGGSTG